MRGVYAQCVCGACNVWVVLCAQVQYVSACVSVLCMCVVCCAYVQCVSACVVLCVYEQCVCMCECGVCVYACVVWCMCVCSVCLYEWCVLCVGAQVHNEAHCRKAGWGNKSRGSGRLFHLISDCSFKLQRLYILSGFP